LLFENGLIPRQINFEVPNAEGPWDEFPFDVPRIGRPWPAGVRRRFAGVSSFGFSGTNAHVLLEEAPPASRSEAPAPSRAAVFLSGKTAEARRVLVSRYVRALAQPGVEADLRGVAY